jgi:hypothetical protein
VVTKSVSSSIAQDKLRFSITYWRRDFARLEQPSSEGLRGLKGAVSFGAEQELELFLIAGCSYELILEGDIVLTDYDDVGDHAMRQFKLGWSPSARQTGTGSGSVRLIHPKFPEEPCCFVVELGDCQSSMAACI